MDPLDQDSMFSSNSPLSSFNLDFLNHSNDDLFSLFENTIPIETEVENVRVCKETVEGSSKDNYTSILLFFPETQAPSFKASLMPCPPTRVPLDVAQKVSQLNSDGNESCFYCPNFNLSIIKRLNLKLTLFSHDLDGTVGPKTLGLTLGPGRWFWQVLWSSSTQTTIIPVEGVKEIRVGSPEISMDTKLSCWQVLYSASNVIAEIPMERVEEIAKKENDWSAGILVAVFPIETELSNTQICRGLDNASIESFKVMSIVHDTSIVHLVQTRVPYGSHQDCMSTTNLGLYVDSYVEHHKERDHMYALHGAKFCGEGQCKIKYPFVPCDMIGSRSYYHATYLNRIGNEDYVLQLCVPSTIKDNYQQEAVRESLSWAMKDHISRFSGKQLAYETIHVKITNASADDQPDSRLVGQSHDMNDGKNVLNGGGMHNAVSYPEIECTRKTLKRKHKSIVSLENIRRCNGTFKEAMETLQVSEYLLKISCREHGILDWRHRHNHQYLSEPKVRIESVQDEGAERGNQMTGGSGSCEKEVSHEEIGFPPESEKGSDRSLMGINVMKDSSTQQEIYQNISATVAAKTKQVPESSQTNLSCFDPDTKITAANAAHMMPLVTERQDTKTVTMKAIYGEDIRRFQVSLTFEFSELIEVVAAKLKLKGGTFKIKYLDDENEWISMDDDGDLQECLKISDSPGFKSIRLRILEVTKEKSGL